MNLGQLVGSLRMRAEEKDHLVDEAPVPLVAHLPAPSSAAPAPEPEPVDTTIEKKRKVDRQGQVLDFIRGRGEGAKVTIHDVRQGCNISHANACVTLLTMVRNRKLERLGKDKSYRYRIRGGAA